MHYCRPAEEELSLHRQGSHPLFLLFIYLADNRPFATHAPPMLCNTIPLSPTYVIRYILVRSVIAFVFTSISSRSLEFFNECTLALAHISSAYRRKVTLEPQSAFSCHILRLHRYTLRLLPALGYAVDRKQETSLEACNDQIGIDLAFAGTLSDFVTITVIGFSYACYRRRRMRNISKTMQEQLIAHVVPLSKIWERRRGSRDEAIASITFIACASA